MVPTQSGFVLYMILLLFNFDLNWAHGDTSEVLSRLYKLSSKGNHPLIIVLDNSNPKEVNRVLAPKESDTTEIDYQMRDPIMNWYERFQSQKKNSKFKLLDPKTSNEGLFNRDKRRPWNQIRNQKFRQWDNKFRSDSNQNRYRHRENQPANIFSRFHDSHEFREHGKYNGNSYSRLPVIKNLLRFSSSLRCAARDECADDCSENFVGKKKDKCEEKCEIKFECPEPTPDPCAEKGECETSDECNQDECNISTKAALFVNEKP